MLGMRLDALECRDLAKGLATLCAAGMTPAAIIERF